MLMNKLYRRYLKNKAFYKRYGDNKYFIKVVAAATTLIGDSCDG